MGDSDLPPGSIAAPSEQVAGAHDSTMAEARRLAESGELAAAEAIYRDLIAGGSLHSVIYSNLGVLCGLDSRYEERFSLLDKAINLDPSNLQARLNLGIAFLEAKDLDAARRCFENCRLLKPDSALALTGLAAVAEKGGDKEEAKKFYAQALEVDPSCCEAYIGLGALELASANYLQAERLFRLCLKRYPNDVATISYLASCLKHQGRLDDALSLLREGAARMPDDAQMTLELVKHLHGIGMADEALEVILCALAEHPENSSIMSWCAVCLRDMGLVDDAIECCSKAHQLAPADSSILNLWGTILFDCGDFDGALDLMSKGLEVEPNDLSLLLNYSGVLRNLGRLDEAIALCEKMMACHPDNQEAFFFPMFTFSIASESYALRALEVGEKAWALFRHGASKAFSPAAVCSDAALVPGAFLSAASMGRGRAIRVGILCPDLGDHVVSRFLIPFLRHYNTQKISIELILSVRRYESSADEIIALADNCLSICGMEIQTARELLRSQCYDILIETSGFTRNSALEVLAERCAPVQCHYIGYHATTALDTIDYFIGDAITVPEEFSWQFRERLWRLPRVWLALEHPEPLPPARELQGDGPLVLGSFNQLAKVRADTLRFWGEALRRMPGSLLVLKDRATGNASIRQRIEVSLADYGVSRDRITYLPPVGSWFDHMDCYNSVDIALDATPWSGATTTVEALSMGVPLVAIRGGCTAARMSSSLLAASGMPPAIAESPNEFASFVEELGRDVAALRCARADRQHVVLSSELFDGAGLARCLEDAFAEMLRIRRVQR